MVKRKKIVFFLFLSGILVSCSFKQPLYQNTFSGAGTFIEVISPFRGAYPLVYREFRRLEKLFNFYDKNSRISQLNALAGIKPLEVEPEFLELVIKARKIYNLTSGYFDPTAGALFNLWKSFIKSKKIESLPSPEIIEELKRLKGFSELIINKKRRTIFIRKKGIVLDLGGVAKGYMVDKAVEALRRAGVTSALINAGGDIFCLGKKSGSFWKVGVRDPRSSEGILKVFLVAGEAVATSGVYEQFFEYKKKRYSHIINPKTGYPLDSDIESLTVIAKDCTTADALATAFLVMGKEKIREFLETTRLKIKVFIVEKKEGGFSTSFLDSQDFKRF